MTAINIVCFNSPWAFGSQEIEPGMVSKCGLKPSAEYLDTYEFLTTSQCDTPVKERNSEQEAKLGMLMMLDEVGDMPNVPSYQLSDFDRALGVATRELNAIADSALRNKKHNYI